MPWYCYIALKQLFPSGRGLSLFSCLSIMGVAIGVWVLVVVISIMNGFLTETRDKLIALNGHIKIRHSAILDGYAPLTEKISDLPGVAAVSPFAEGIVMITADEARAYPAVRGMDTMNPNPVVALEDYLVAGSVADLVDWTVIVGSKLAENMNVQVGDSITLFTPLIMDRLKTGEVLLAESLEVAGIFATGYNMVDENVILVTLRKMQDLYALDSGVHGLVVRLEPDADAVEVADQLKAKLDRTLWVETWREANHDFFAAVENQKAVMYFMLIAISVVAAFSIAISLLTTVMRKTREIGIYAAMGARRAQIGWLFSIEGFCIGIIGTLLGMAAAVIFLHFRDSLIAVIADVTGSRDVLVHYYQFETLPASYAPLDLMVITVLALTISTLASFVPALRAAWLKPSTALRNG